MKVTRNGNHLEFDSEDGWALSPAYAPAGDERELDRIRRQADKHASALKFLEAEATELEAAEIRRLAKALQVAGDYDPPFAAVDWYAVALRARQLLTPAAEPGAES